MLWIYRRHDGELRVETLLQERLERFRVRLWGSGREICEEFETTEAFRTRLVQLEDMLHADGWVLQSGPMLDPAEALPTFLERDRRRRTVDRRRIPRAGRRFDDWLRRGTLERKPL